MASQEAASGEQGAGALGPIDLPDEVVRIAERLEEAGFETWAVGGALRDRLLGIQHGDVDLATAATPDTVISLFPHTVPIGVDHGTVGVLDRQRELHEVTTFRRDVRTDGRHAVVEFGVSLEDDLARRDFTINALAYHPRTRTWRDPFGGHADLRAGIVRAVGDPAQRFREDYLRILRAVRFAARFGFAIDPGTWQAAVEAAAGLGGLSAERVRDEWFKGLASARSLRELVRLWHDTGGARVWLAELSREWPGGSDAPEERDPVVLTAVAVSAPAAVLRRFRCSGDDITRAEGIVRGPARPASGSPEGVRRWLAAVGLAARDLLLLERYRTGQDASWAAEAAAIRTRGEATSRAGLAVTGNDLVALGIAPGPALGVLFDRLLDAVLRDPARNTREGLLDLARAWR